MVKKDWKALRQQRTNTLFCDLLEVDIHEWCNSEGIKPDVKSIIGYLVKHNILRQSIINRYVVIKEYPLYFEKEGGKQNAVYALSNLVPLEPKGVYSILANYSGHFRPNRFKFEL